MTLGEVFLADDPVPVGIRVGDLLHLLRLSDLSQLRPAVEAAGATLANVAQVSFFVASRDALREINPPWLQLFPDQHDRPTYKFMLAERPSLEAFAVAGQRRRPLHIPNVAHTNPIPMGVRIGNYLFSSRVLPYDPANSQPPETVEGQAECLFQNVRTLLQVGEMPPEAIRQGRLFLADLADRPIAERYWESLTRDCPSLPALHVSPYALAPSLRVMLEIIATR
jgi:enamine deaminase RidA (YjgF/YER057c/UK114 family)